MRLGLGPSGPRTYPYVGTLPGVIIMFTSIIGVGYLFTGGKFILSPSIRDENWWLVKLLGATVVGFAIAQTFIFMYELNHELQHASRTAQREAILGRERAA
jgi:hypothetical protein